MSITTTIKLQLNSVLRNFNIRVDTLTAEVRERARIQALQKMGQFDAPVFPAIPGLESFDVGRISQIATAYREDLENLMCGRAKPGGFDPTNGFYVSPDAEILYLMIRSLSPRRVLEIGSGNSTRIVRQAIIDGRMQVEHVAIDPSPRAEIEHLVDKVYKERLENVDVTALTQSLESGDILFIDSSHEVRVANDVVKLFCCVLPSLPDGVIVHVHDVFLPFDYPAPFFADCPTWGEQYMLQVFLQSGNHEVLWPGFYLQKLRQKEFASLGFLGEGRAQSFWFRLSTGRARLGSGM